MSDPVNRVMSPGSCVLVNEDGVELKVIGVRADVSVVGSVTAVAGGDWRTMGAGGATRTIGAAAWVAATSVIPMSIMFTSAGSGPSSIGLRIGTVGEGSAAMPPVRIDVDTALLGLLESSPLVSADVETLDMRSPLPEKEGRL
jgi:hypothetical protein